MARILISHFSGVFDKQWEITCFYDGLIQSLVRNGNEVLHLISNDFITEPWGGKQLHYLSGIRQKQVEDDIKSFKPDFVLTFNNSTIPNLDNLVECPILIWDADASIYFCDLENLKKKKDRYHFLAFSKSGLKELKENLNLSDGKLFWVPAATDIRAENKTKERNIAFIGTNFKTPDSLKIDFLKDPALRKRCFEALNISKGDFHKLIENLNFLPLSLLKSISSIVSANKRVKALDAISTLGVELYGTSSWIDLLDYSYLLALSYNEKIVYSLQHNQDIYNSSKISFSISHNQSVTGFPWRIYDIMASNSCLVADFKQDLYDETKDYIPNLPMYNSPEEAKALSEEVLKNDQLREEIITRSNQYIDNNCRFEHRFEILENILGLKIVNIDSKGNYKRLMPINSINLLALEKLVKIISKFLSFEQMRFIYKVVFIKFGIRLNPNFINKVKLHVQ